MNIEEYLALAISQVQSGCKKANANVPEFVHLEINLDGSGNVVTGNIVEPQCTLKATVRLTEQAPQ